ncbi:MAG: helix-turn-helix transcriptional regulator [Thiobacillus sp.]|nr:helix-turn-helix transcriptional regulator [Thiobacillus sp.]
MWQRAVTRPVSPFPIDILDLVNGSTQGRPSLPDLLGLIAQSVDADLIQVGIDIGTGYRRDCFVEQNTEIANFSDVSQPPFVVTRETRVQRSASPSGLIATPNWLDQRTLHVGSAGRRSAPRSGIALLRSPARPAFKASERRQFTLLLPHFNLSLALACELERTRTIDSHVRSALECARYGFLLLNREGTPLHGNTLAFELLDRAHIRMMPRLRLPGARLQGRFEAALAPSVAHGLQACRLVVDAAPPVTLDLHPLPAASDRHTLNVPTFILLVRQGGSPPSLSEAVAQHFDLTPAEFRLCNALASGLSLKACAQAWNRSYETLRSQLKTILSKTGTHRQIELVALLDTFKTH